MVDGQYKSVEVSTTVWSDLGKECLNKGSREEYSPEGCNLELWDSNYSGSLGKESSVFDSWNIIKNYIDILVNDENMNLVDLNIRYRNFWDNWGIGRTLPDRVPYKFHTDGWREDKYSIILGSGLGHPTEFIRSDGKESCLPRNSLTLIDNVDSFYHRQKWQSKFIENPRLSNRVFVRAVMGKTKL